MQYQVSHRMAIVIASKFLNVLILKRPYEQVGVEWFDSTCINQILDMCWYQYYNIYFINNIQQIVSHLSWKKGHIFDIEVLCMFFKLHRLSLHKIRRDWTDTWLSLTKNDTVLHGEDKNRCVQLYPVKGF